MGVLTWTVGLARLVWRQRFTYLQQWIAKTNEYRLYVLL